MDFQIDNDNEHFISLSNKTHVILPLTYLDDYNELLQAYQNLKTDQLSQQVKTIKRKSAFDGMNE
jgi:hypothetical protein